MAEFVSDVLDSIPGVGHTKGIVHYACGDKEGAKKAWTSATRTVAVLGAGVIGLAVAGPVGAAVNATVTAVCYGFRPTALLEGRQGNGLITNPGVDTGDHRCESSDESDYEEEYRASVAQVEIFSAVVQDITRLMKCDGIPIADQHYIINRCFKDFLTAAIPLMNSPTIRLTIRDEQLQIVGVNRQIISPYQAVWLSMAITRAIINARAIRERCSRRSCRFCPNLREIRWEQGRTGCCETKGAIYSFYCRDCNRIVYAGQTTRPLRDRISGYLDSDGSPLRRHIASTAGHRNPTNDLLDIFSIIPMWSTNGVETTVYDRNIGRIVKNWAVFMQWLI